MAGLTLLWAGANGARSAEVRRWPPTRSRAVELAKRETNRQAAPETPAPRHYPPPPLVGLVAGHAAPPLEHTDEPQAVADFFGVMRASNSSILAGSMYGVYGELGGREMVGLRDGNTRNRWAAPRVLGRLWPAVLSSSIVARSGLGSHQCTRALRREGDREEAECLRAIRLRGSYSVSSERPYPSKQPECLRCCEKSLSR